MVTRERDGLRLTRRRRDPQAIRSRDRIGASCISIVREDMPSFYPRLPDFQAIRRKMDPAGRFLNDHLRNLFA